MITQLSLSHNTTRNLNSFGTNQSQAIELLARMYLSGELSGSPYIIADRSAKQIISVNMSPYTIGILKEFSSVGVNSSQAVEWLVKVYTDTPIQPQSEPEPVAKVAKVARVRASIPTRAKKQLVRSSDHGPVTKKAKKLKLVKR